MIHLNYFIIKNNIMISLCEFSFLNKHYPQIHFFFFLVLTVGKSLLRQEKNTWFYYDKDNTYFRLCQLSCTRCHMYKSDRCLLMYLTLNGLLFQAAVSLRGEISGELSKKKVNYFSFQKVCGSIASHP